MCLKTEDELETNCFIETEKKNERIAKAVLFMKNVTDFQGEFSSYFEHYVYVFCCKIQIDIEKTKHF